VNASVGEVVAPGEGLAIEVEQVGEAASRPEAIPNEADRALDAAFFVGTSDVASGDGEAAPRVCILEEAAIEAGGERRVREHDGFHVVEDACRGDTTEEAERSIHDAQERAHRLTEREFDVEQPRVRERRHECAETARAAGQRVTEVSPIDLKGRCRREIQRQESFGVTSGSQPAEPVAHDRDSAAKTERPEPLEHRRRPHLRRVVEQLANRGQVRIEQGIALGRRSRTPDGSASENSAHRIARQAELARNRA
jgi:hypothetical protein